MFNSDNLHFHYVAPNGLDIDAGHASFDEDWWCSWMQGMVDKNPDTIFFLVTETTDVFEQEWDFNTVVQKADDNMISHTFSPLCPEGCRGQLDDCAFKGEFSVSNEEISETPPLRAVNDAFNHGQYTDPMFMQIHDPSLREE